MRAHSMSSPIPAGPQRPPLIAANNVTDNARRAHAEWHKLPNLSCSPNFLAIRVKSAPPDGHRVRPLLLQFGKGLGSIHHATLMHDPLPSHLAKPAKLVAEAGIEPAADEAYETPALPAELFRGFWKMAAPL